VSFINECKVGDFAPVQLMEIYRGCVGIAPLILTLDSVLSLVVSITQYLIKSGVNSPLYTLNISLSRHFQENEFISPSKN
jgi:hypothetical protein